LFAFRQQDCQLRVVEGWNDLLLDLRREAESRGEEGAASGYGDGDDEPTLLVAHANTLRALVMHLDDISPAEIEDVNIGTALPFYYDVDVTTGRVVAAAEDERGREEQGRKRAGGRGSSPPSFRGIYIDDERKRRNFLERRRAANDPWLWALHDDQVSPGMLLVNGEVGGSGRPARDGPSPGGGEDGAPGGAPEGTDGLEAEARHNTETFAASALKPAGSRPASPGHTIY
jgi:2,3-bisphosphoglycerate-dependent phosphoglycerate mutase